MRRALTTLILVGLAILLATHLHTYAGLNAGILLDLPSGHWCGFEYRGTIGPFCDVT